MKEGGPMKEAKKRKSPFVVFTKHFQPLSLKELAQALCSVDADGADLCVRPGYPVNPENVEKKLPLACKIFAEYGLMVGLVTTPGDFTEPEKPETERLLAACGQEKIKLIKLGYWFMEKDGYWKTVDRIRKKLAVFSKLAEKYQVKVMIHNHSGQTMGLNSCAVMNLVKDFDPEYIGVFADTGHLMLVGEPFAMAVDIIGDYWSALALKDVIRQKVFNQGREEWQLRVVGLGQGYVDWQAVVRMVKEKNFAGPISFHSEYAGLEVQSLTDQTRMDIRFFRKMLEQFSRSS